MEDDIVIVKSSNDYVVSIGETYRCYGDGNPSPHVYWLKIYGNGTDVVDSWELLTDGTMIGANTYSCVIENDLGGANKSVDFFVGKHAVDFGLKSFCYCLKKKLNISRIKIILIKTLYSCRKAKHIYTRPTNI